MTPSASGQVVACSPLIPVQTSHKLRSFPCRRHTNSAHSRASGNPEATLSDIKDWVPAFAGTSGLFQGPLLTLPRDDSGEFIEDFAHTPLHVRRPHLAHAIVARDEISVPFGARARSLLCFLWRHEIDDAFERERNEICNVRADRHLPLEAAAGKAAGHHPRPPPDAVSLPPNSAQPPWPTAQPTSLSP